MTGSFSAEFRATTWKHHEQAADSTFLDALVAGEVDRLGYADMVAQHYSFIVSWRRRRGQFAPTDRVVGGLVSPGLTRLPAIEMDLGSLFGEDWAQQVRPNRATEGYCQRLRGLSPGRGFVAHHYTRYLGDLSGGQYLRHDLARALQLSGDVGTRFYVFDDIADVDAFKVAYRQRLDTMPWDEAEHATMVKRSHAFVSAQYGCASGVGPGARSG